uniref:Purple acid phosphatase n=1 Tax=Achlya hypogyna TaxID=1202772 RepID=A0A0A7CPR3_ACHHY|nr:secreted protein [Achlya hypogyna]
MKLATCLLALTTAAIATDDKWVGGLGMLHDTPDHCRHSNGTHICEYEAHDGRRLDTPAATISVSATSINHLAQVEVSYTAVSPSAGDRIAAYCASPVTTAADSDYMDFQLTSGVSGTLTFGPLVNMRCDYQFRYQKAVAPKQFVTQATSAVVHLALTGNAGEMRVKWTSAAVTNPTVRYGIVHDNCGDPDLSLEAAATADTYAAVDMCGAPATTVSAITYIPVGTFYDAVLTQLPPNAHIKYQVGDAVAGWSDVFTFKMPDLGSRRDSRFFVFGDMGTWTTATGGLGLDGRSLSTAKRVAADAATADYAAVLHVGDLSYADSVGYTWEQWMALIEPIAAQLPYMVSVGNHEYAYTTSTHAVDVSGASQCFFPTPAFAKASSGGECGVPTAKRFHMPGNGNGVFWYSFDMGLVHQVVVSSEHDFNTGSRMRQWLEADLAAVDRTKTPWVFFHVHRPMYVSINTSNDQAYNTLSRAAYEPLLAKYVVDAVFTGHVHNYERTCPVFGGMCNTAADGKAKAPVHIMIGSAGKLLDTGANLAFDWSAKWLHEYGYGRVHVPNATHAHFEFVQDVDGVVADDVWIVSDHQWGSV